MPGFSKGGGAVTPFGKNEYRRSTVGIKTRSYTCSSSSHPVETIDAATDQKVLQSGEVMAKITSGGESGKVGVFMAGVSDGRQTLANIVGINDTFLPWQLMEHDMEVAVVNDAEVVQGWCYERDSGGARIALTNTTAAGMVAQKTMNILFT